jgi:hypothetical protein
MDCRLVRLSSSPEPHALLWGPAPDRSIRRGRAKYPDEFARPLLEPLDERRVVRIDAEELLSLTKRLARSRANHLRRPSMDYAEMHGEIGNTPAGTGRDIARSAVLKRDGQLSALSLDRIQIMVRVHRGRVAPTKSAFVRRLMTQSAGALVGSLPSMLVVVPFFPSLGRIRSMPFVWVPDPRGWR